MKRRIALFVVLLIFFSIDGATAAKTTAKKSVDALLDVKINGCVQKILVQSENTESPILLYLHGGPGDPAMMYSYYYSSLLKKKFIFVNWDQRGAGLSYHEGMDASGITESQLCSDALELTKYLIKKYSKKKIYIIGHSFGSILGLNLAYNHPQYFYAYVGMGQVLDFDRSAAITNKWLRGVMEKAKDADGLKRTKNGGVPPVDLIRKYGGITHTPVDNDGIIKKSPYYFDGYIELKNKARSFTQDAISRYGDYDGFRLMDIRELKIPVFFFEGKYDHIAASAPELVIEFCRRVKAPDKEIVWFENSAHMINLEEPVKLQQMLIDKVLAEKTAA